MRVFSKVFIAICSIVFLTGCSDTLSDVKKAASGINSKANEAASAISQDVHSIRAIEIEHNNTKFTVNDLFKTILRDVQWHYEKQNETISILRITGTWQPTLFESLNFNSNPYLNLTEHGQVEISLHINEHILIEDKTKAILTYEGQEIFSNKGEAVLQYLFDYYTSK